MNEQIERAEILKELIILSENRLALKIWLQLAAYCYKELKCLVSLEEKQHLLTMLKAIQMNYLQEVSAWNCIGCSWEIKACRNNVWLL